MRDYIQFYERGADGLDAPPLLATIPVARHTQHLLHLSNRQQVEPMVLESRPGVLTDVARWMEEEFNEVGEVTSLSFKRRDEDYPYVATYVIGEAMVIPHDSTKRWSRYMGCRDWRGPLDVLADLPGSVERVAEVKRLDVLYRDDPIASNFDALMQARARLQWYDWKWLAGKDHYAPFHRPEQRAREYWELTGGA